MALVACVPGGSARSELRGGDEVVPVSWLVLGPPIRDGGVHEEHVRRLMDDAASWPPVLVSRDDLCVIDGRHRVVAARRMGLHSIAVAHFDGDAGEAFIEFLRRNAVQGLPLSRGERQRAARRLLHLHPNWADRRVGNLCGISSKAVAQLRTRLAETFPTSGVDDVEVRVGRDGRSRPVDPAAQRARIVEALQLMPGASLRAVAQEVGASPETVRGVRASMLSDTPSADCSVALDDLLQAVLIRSVKRVSWRSDAAFASRDDGDATAAFLERTEVAGVDPTGCAASVPLSRVYEVADEARRRAAFWTRLADGVEGRAKRRC